jgi:hypothetical protein
MLSNLGASQASLFDAISRRPVWRQAACCTLFLVLTAPAFAQLTPPRDLTSPPDPTVCGPISDNDARYKVATRHFPDLQPTPGHPPTLSPPGFSGSTLKVVVFGDSVMWGNGLTDPEKFVLLAGQSIADASGKNVHIDSFAHSGSRLALCDNATVPLVPYKSTDSAPPGDLDSQRPSTIQQADIAHDNVNDGDADIVLMDGCINEVGATKIAFPYFFDFVTKEDIAVRVHKYCADQMAAALTHVVQLFPNATILLMNYYRVVSSKSSPWNLANVSADPSRKDPEAIRKEIAASASTRDALRQKDVDNLFRTADKIEARSNLSRSDPTPDSGAKTMTREDKFSSRWQAWADNSTMFLERTQGCFTWAVATANGQQVKPLGDALDAACPTITSGPPRNPHVFLVTVPDNPDYSYGAPQKHVWSVPVKFLWWVMRSDDLYRERLKLCKSHFDDGTKRFSCSVNPTAHPNASGADAYRDSIIESLKKAWNQ